MIVDGYQLLATPGLIPAIDAYVTPAKDVPDPSVVRTRRSVNEPPTSYTRGKVASVYDAQIDAILSAAGIKAPQADPSSARVKMRGEIRRGIFDATYWILATQSAAAYLQTIPDSTADLNPPTFPGRDPANMPSIPMYDLGELTTAPCIYSGYTSGGLYKDMLLRWQRITLDFTKPITADLLTHPIIYIEIDQQIASSNRGVRTAQDCAVMAWIHAPGDSIEQTTTPPVHPDYSYAPPADATYWRLFYRFEKPLSAPPYYDATNSYAAHMRALKIATPRAAENQTRITILVAPRPAYGLEYAGNTALNQTTTFVVRAWQPGSKTLIVVGQANSPSGIRAFRWTAAGGMVDIGTLPGGTSSRAYDIS